MQVDNDKRLLALCQREDRRYRECRNDSEAKDERILDRVAICILCTSSIADALPHTDLWRRRTAARKGRAEIPTTA